jgi:RimJ/RimL family protein N-acetyltransferase
MQTRESRMILKNPSGAFLEVAKVWHRDEELNKLTGFGSGQPGVLLAERTMGAMLNAPSSVRMYALWEDDTPLGYTVFTDIDEKNRTADLHITLPPIHQGSGLGVEALLQTTGEGFKRGLWRITFKPMVTNQRAVEAAAKAGYKVEARTRGSIWMDSGPKDQTQMRAIKPEWEKKYGNSRRR